VDAAGACPVRGGISRLRRGSTDRGQECPRTR
jgi:hypothetical protein